MTQTHDACRPCHGSDSAEAHGRPLIARLAGWPLLIRGGADAAIAGSEIGCAIHAIQHRSYLINARSRILAQASWTIPR